MARFLFFWTHCTTPISCLLFLFSYRNFTMTIAWTSDKPTSSNHRTSIAPSKWMIIRLITSSIWQLKRSMGKAKRSVFFCIPFWCKYSRFFTTHLFSYVQDYIPVSTRRRFNVVTTLLTSKQRCINGVACLLGKRSNFHDRYDLALSVNGLMLFQYSTMFNSWRYTRTMCTNWVWIVLAKRPNAKWNDLSKYPQPRSIQATR